MKPLTQKIIRILTVLVLFVVFASAGPDKTPVNINVHIEFSNAACGNNPASAKKPLTNWVLKFVDEMDPKTKTAMAKTNATGDLTASLKPGTYNIYMTKKINKSLKSNMDVACKKLMSKSYGQIVVSKSHAKTYRLIFTFDCSPCKPAPKKGKK